MPDDSHSKVDKNDGFVFLRGNFYYAHNGGNEPFLSSRSTLLNFSLNVVDYIFLKLYPMKGIKK